MNKKYLLYFASGAIALATVGTIAAGTVSADTRAASKPNFMSDLVNVIAQKFNLNPMEVEQVISGQKTQMEAKMKAQMDARFSDKLKQTVASGKLSQEQANKITAKKAELEAQKPTKTQMDALKQWAADNNIPLQYLMFGGFGGRPGFGPKGHN